MCRRDLTVRRKATKSAWGWRMVLEPISHSCVCNRILLRVNVNQ
jgi:hypothetical protein